jgi:hypothetical protein
MNRILASALLSISLTTAHAGAADKPAAPSAKAARPTTRKAATHKTAPAPTPEPPETLTETQLEFAARVLTGRANCEFKQNVVVTAVDGAPGHFDVVFGKQSFHMVPQETTTGAIRLVDRKADVVWLQIPVKSMLMNNRVGQRMVDACQHPEQMAAVEALEAARLAATAAAQAGALAAQAETPRAATQAAASAALAAEAAASAAASAASAVASLSPPEEAASAPASPPAPR